MHPRALLSTAAVLILLWSGGCASMLARHAVTPPERGEVSKAAKVRAVMVRFRHERDFWIHVGPPDARIAVTVIDPRMRIDSITINGRSAIRTTPSASRAMPYSFGEPLRGTIFVLPGISNTRMMIPYQFWASVLSAAGYRVVLVDLRGHGESTGSYLTYGAEERFDLVQVLDALQEFGQVAGDVGVLGASYGGAVAIQWAAVDPRVKAVVALEPFSSFRQAVHDAAPHVLGFWKIFYSKQRIDQIVDRAAALAGFNPDDANPAAAIGRMTQPVLLIHGADDTFLPPANSRRIHSAAAGDSRLVILPGVGHADLWINGFEPIRDLTLDWMDQYLYEPRAGDSY